MAKLNIRIDVIDNASPALSKINAMMGRFDALKNKSLGGAGGLISAISGLNSSIPGLGSAISVASSSLEALSKGIKAIAGGLQSADKLTGDIFSAANTISAVSGESLSNSLTLANNVVAELGKAAATLPGETEDYIKSFNLISDTIAAASQNLDGSLNKSEFLQRSKALTTSMYLLGKQSGLAAENTTRAIERAVTGSGNFTRLAFFMRNPALVKLIESEMTSLGKSMDDWALLTTKQRADIVEKSMGKLISPEMIATLSNSIEGQLEGLKAVFTNPITGLFSFFRKSKFVDNGKIIEKSALDSFKILLRNISGSLFGVFRAVGIINDKGEATDIVNRIFIQLFEVVNAKVLTLKTFFTAYKVDPYLMGQVVGKFIGELPKYMTGAISSMLGYFSQIDMSKVVGNSLEFLAGATKGLVSGITNSVISVVTDYVPNLIKYILTTTFEVVKGTIVGTLRGAAKMLNPFDAFRPARADTTTQNQPDASQSNYDATAPTPVQTRYLGSNMARTEYPNMAPDTEKILGNHKFMVGLASAAAKEKKAMPHGAEIVVANSSETIIPNKIKNYAAGNLSGLGGFLSDNFSQALTPETKERNDRAGMVAMARNIVQPVAPASGLNFAAATFNSMLGAVQEPQDPMADGSMGAPTPDTPKKEKKSGGGIFGKIFGGIKKVASGIGSGIKKAVGAVGKFVTPIANFISPIASIAAPLASFVPGLQAIAPILGTIGKVTSGGGAGVLGYGASKLLGGLSGVLGASASPLANRAGELIASKSDAVLQYLGLNDPSKGYKFKKPSITDVFRNTGIISELPGVSSVSGVIGSVLGKNSSLLHKIPILRDIIGIDNGNLEQVVKTIKYLSSGNLSSQIGSLIRNGAIPQSVPVAPKNVQYNTTTHKTSNVSNNWNSYNFRGANITSREIVSLFGQLLNQKTSRGMGMVT